MHLFDYSIIYLRFPHIVQAVLLKSLNIVHREHAYCPSGGFNSGTSLDKVFGVSTSTSGDAATNLKEIRDRWMSIAVKKIPEVAPEVSNKVHYFPESHKFQTYTRIETSRSFGSNSVVKININPKIPYILIKETGNSKTYRMAGDQDPFFVPNLAEIQRDGFTENLEVIEIYKEDGRPPVFKTMSNRDCRYWVDAKINLYSLIYYQLKLKYLYIFEGQNGIDRIKASAEGGETSQDEASIFLLDSKIAFAANKAWIYDTLSSTDSLIQEKHFDELEEDVYSQAKLMAQDACEKKNRTWKGPNEPSYPRYTALIQMRGVIDEAKLRSTLEASGKFKDKKVLDYIVKTYARYDTPTKFFQKECTEAMLLYGNNNSTDYIKRAFFDGNATFVQMSYGGFGPGDEMLQYIKEGFDTHEVSGKPQVGLPTGPAVSLPEEELPKYKTESNLKVLTHSAKYGQPMEVGKADVPRTSSYKGKYYDDVDLNNRLEALDKSSPRELSKSMGTQVKAIAGVEEDKGSPRWDKFCRGMRDLAGGTVNVVGDFWDWLPSGYSMTKKYWYDENGNPW